MRASLSFARSRTSSFLPPSVTRRNAHCGSGSVLRPAARWASTALSGRSVESGSGGHSPAHLGDGGHGGGDGDASRGGGGGDGDGRTGRYPRHSGGHGCSPRSFHIAPAHAVVLWRQNSGGGQWTGTGAGDGSGRHTGIGDGRTIGDGDGSSGGSAARK